MKSAVEIGLSKILFHHEAVLQQRKKEQMELNLLIRKRKAKAAKVQRITMMQNERKGRIKRIIKVARCPSEACQVGVPFEALKRIVREDMERTVGWFRKQQKSRLMKRGGPVVEESDEDEDEEDDDWGEEEPRHIIDRNDVFGQLCTNTNAMVVESLHPYKPSACHVVELTPNDEGGVLYGSESGLVIAFHHHCDIKSGNAEIRFFEGECGGRGSGAEGWCLGGRCAIFSLIPCMYPPISDTTCTKPLGNEVYTNENLPSLEDPLLPTI